MKSIEQKPMRELSKLLLELGAEIFSSNEDFVSARFKAPEWIKDALLNLGIRTELVERAGSSEPALKIAVPQSDAASLKLSLALRTVLNPQALLFDMDDTLADVTESYRAATLATAASFGVQVTLEDITDAKARGGANNDWELTRRLINARGADATLDKVTRKFEEFYQGTPESPGMRKKETPLASPELLERLASKAALGVVTGRPLKDALAFLEANGIRRLFRALVTMDDGPLKPDPKPCLLALARLGIQRAWMVGDTPDDMRSARGAGVLPIGVIAPSDDPKIAHPALMQAGAARVVDRIADLEELLP